VIMVVAEEYVVVDDVLVVVSGDASYEMEVVGSRD